jgi:hypothetical protein
LLTIRRSLRNRVQFDTGGGKGIAGPGAVIGGCGNRAKYRFIDFRFSPICLFGHVFLLCHGFAGQEKCQPGLRGVAGVSERMTDEKRGDGGFPAAIMRLNQALDALETAIDGRFENQRSLTEAEAEVQRVEADRAKLAQSLDTNEARAQRLEKTNREVSRRLVDAMETIRTVLDGKPAAVED